MDKKFDVIVVGGGHAGCEAALVCARRGVNTLLITFEKDKIGYTSCNPSIGGVGKGQLVKEVDALGGEMGKAADAACIQYRMLNLSKGYAARSSRMQIDRKIYNKYMHKIVTHQDDLEIYEGEVTEIVAKDGVCQGVKTGDGKIFVSEAVILTPGTFMDGTIHIGLEHSSGGRIGEKSSIGLSNSLMGLGFQLGLLKTGTPARLDGKTIDFSALDKQEGDENIIPFSFDTDKLVLQQLPCYLTRTNQNTHGIIANNLDRSPLYSGKIKAQGVRYCPSIEDKIVKFPKRDSHLVFLEPEGLDTDEYYPNGISTSLPLDVQENIIRSIKGLEKVKINKPAYGIEYSFVEPTQLAPTLEAKIVKGLFMAGQINGTTGYEEGAALGLMAGINASLKIRKEEPLILKRSQAYIAVLIDDLVTKGTKEPYRMFTSRVEYRLTVREDNADTRLSPIGHSLGLISEGRIENIKRRKIDVENEKKRLKKLAVLSNEKINHILEKNKEKPFEHKISSLALLKRTNISYDLLSKIIDNDGFCLDYYGKVQLEVDVKYKGYIERELKRIEKFGDLEKIKIPKDFDYNNIPGLSNEITEKLTGVQPVTLGQASRISGVTPAAISILMVKLKNKKKQGQRTRSRGQ